MGAERVGRLYFPIANEAGMLSWVSPALQGGPASSHNEYLGLPLTAEDLPNSLVHRGFWIAEPGRSAFSISSLCSGGRAASPAVVDVGPGWFRLSRNEGQGRFRVRATLWCPADVVEKLEIMLVEVTNTSRRKLEFAPYAAIPVFARSADNVRDHRHVTALLHRIQAHGNGITVCPTMSFDERGHKINKVRYSVLAAGPGGSAPEAVWPTQDSFLGEGGSFAAPQAVWGREAAPRSLKPEDVQGREALAGFRFGNVSLRPGKTVRFVLLSGISEDAGSVRRWARWLSRAGNASRSLEFTKKHWLENIGRLAFLTPDTALNNWLAWVNFQPTLRRLYGNSYLPQFDYGRGGRGWRDLWQDRLALLLSDPASVRPVLLQNFGGVRIDGSNATIIGKGGRFLADRNNIPRTWMDHGVWPTYTTLLYIDQTGDLNFLLAEREYFRDPQLFRCRRRDGRWTEAYGNELRTRGGAIYRGSILEHMLVQNLTAFFNVGEHNVCRLEGADWNDGLDMAEERGESVAFSAFYAWNLERLAVLVEQLAPRGHGTVRLGRELLALLDRVPGGRRVNYGSARARRDRLESYLASVARDPSGRKAAVPAGQLAADLRAKSRDLYQRIRRQEWIKAGKGAAFFNGYYDNDGRRVEGRRGGRVRMTLTGQVFPLMSGVATDEQVDAVIRSADRLLKESHGGIRLNTDFGGIQPALGRAFSFAYGEKENGAVFSHMAVMYAFALYARRRAREGRRVWAALHAMARDTQTAKIFPCLPEYFNAAGRGMYCYLTGSASWLVYLLLTRVFGVRGEGGDLVMDPQLTLEDFGKGAETAIRADFAGRAFEFVFRNPGRLEAGRYRVESVAIGGRALPVSPLPGGGVCITRRTLKALPGNGRILLIVRLGR